MGGRIFLLTVCLATTGSLRVEVGLYLCEDANVAVRAFRKDNEEKYTGYIELCPITVNDVTDDTADLLMRRGEEF
jgi:hypothetical protein